jgi:hypothetical protein
VVTDQVVIAANLVPIVVFELVPEDVPVDVAESYETIVWQ